MESGSYNAEEITEELIKQADSLYVSGFTLCTDYMTRIARVRGFFLDFPPAYNAVDVIVVAHATLIGHRILSSKQQFTHHETEEKLLETVDKYDRLLPRCVLLVPRDQETWARSLLPHHWGITVFGTVGGCLTFHSARDPELNPELDVSELISFLTSAEMVLMLGIAELRGEPLGFEPDFSTSAAIVGQLERAYGRDGLEKLVSYALRTRRGRDRFLKRLAAFLKTEEDYYKRVTAP